MRTLNWDYFEGARPVGIVMCWKRYFVTCKSDWSCTCTVCTVPSDVLHDSFVRYIQVCALYRVIQLLKLNLPNFVPQVSARIATRLCFCSQ